MTSFTPPLLNETDNSFTPEHLAKFKDFFRCVKKYEKVARTCAQKWLDEPCRKSSVRIIKTVRANMQVADAFYDIYPNFRLVHLFRDPRGAVKSKMDSHWSHGRYELKNLTRIAQGYCQNVLSDYMLRQQLEMEHPGQSTQILSDDFMVRSLDYVEDIAELIGKNVSLMKARLRFKLRNKGINAVESTDHTDRLLEDQRNASLRLASYKKSPSRKILQLMAVDDQDESEGTHNASSQLTNKTLKERIMGQLAQDWGIGGLKYRAQLGLLNQTMRKPPLRGEPRLQKWQATLLWKEVKEIEHLCEDFYNEIPYDWTF